MSNRPSSAELEIRMHRPHVVILGAGCSRAAFPNGDANGLKLPLMCDFLDILTPVRDLLESVGVQTSGRNFEEAYSEIVADGRRDLCLEVEALIYHYFSALRLPYHP